MSEQDVVAAVIRRNGAFLVCKRPEHKRHGGLWEFPGGKVENGETLFDAVSRELSEELALATLSVGKRLFSSMESDSGFRVIYLLVEAAGDPKLLEHSELAWLTPASLLQLSLCPSDRAFLEHLISSGLD
ncbi:MAG: (deoxy)nucleoside triphosphate pyrophosphohydrolase [Candidatus Obscuribacterales bacterium]|nr:(deoxy)nucleoside triphosphate pyrophosphohydrolase [Candidatus Obscuribacterales bacterium]